MATQKRREHEQLRKELELRYKNVAKNMEYSPMVGCDMAIGNKGGVKRRRVRESASIGCMDAQEGLMQRHTTVQKGQNIAHLQGDLRRI